VEKKTPNDASLARRICGMSIPRIAGSRRKVDSVLPHVDRRLRAPARPTGLPAPGADFDQFAKSRKGLDG
jgi:hypothetical protein